MKELKATDKVRQKMTRAGLTEENLATGETENVSSRPAEESNTEQATNTAGIIADRTEEIMTRQSSKKAIQKAQNTLRQGKETLHESPSRLQFSEDDLATPELQKAIQKSDRAADKLDKARDAIPKKKRLMRERTYDEVSGKGKTSLRFKDTDIPVNQSIQRNPLSRPLHEIRQQVHTKIRQVEHDNVGTESGHLAEQAAERCMYEGSRIVKDSIRKQKLSPYRLAAKAEKASIKANADFYYRKALHDNPGLASSNPVSKYFQKQQIKRNYAAQLKNSKKTTKESGKAVKGATSKAIEAGKKAGNFIIQNWKPILIALGVGLICFSLLSSCSAFSNVAMSGLNSIVSSSYTSEDADILGAEGDYNVLETSLREQSEDIESTHPGYDEYRYNLDEIGHDPYELASYLTALYPGYTRAEVQGALQELFSLQYSLTSAVTTETRYRAEERTETIVDPATGEIQIRTYTEQVPYEYRILTTTLSNRAISAIVPGILTADQMDLYRTYTLTKGNRDYLFADNPYVSGGGSYTNYDIPGEALSDGTFASLIREAEKYLGYPYVWGGSSPSTSFDCSGFVSYVIRTSGVYPLERTTAQGIFNQCAIIPRSEAKPGDIIFFTGTYASSGPVSHTGIYVGNGMMIHCGNPISYASIDSNYWTSHFYAFGRLNYN